MDISLLLKKPAIKHKKYDPLRFTITAGFFLGVAMAPFIILVSIYRILMGEEAISRKYLWKSVP
jgi:hypothetical protein